MYLHLGQDVLVRMADVVGIFDMDNTTVSRHTREFLAAAEQAGQVVSITYELPRSFVVCIENGNQTVYLCQLAPATLRKRLREGMFPPL